MSDVVQNVLFNRKGRKGFTLSTQRTESQNLIFAYLNTANVLCSNGFQL